MYTDTHTVGFFSLRRAHAIISASLCVIKRRNGRDGRANVIILPFSLSASQLFFVAGCSRDVWF